MAPNESVQHKDPTKSEKKEEKLLDKSLEDSFPASDPSSVTRAPKEKRETAKPPAQGADRKTPIPAGGKAESDSDKNR